MAVVFIDYIKFVQKNKYVDYDVKTITAGDYTVEFVIEKAMYETFKEKFYNEASPLPEITQFRVFVKDEIEKRLTEMPDNHMDGIEGATKPVKIALITFAYDNAKAINWLR